MIKRLSLGIALGGGGARGAAHIGVLQELSNAEIEIDTISGVSAGAVIAAMYAYSKDPFWIENKFRKLLNQQDYKSSFGFFFSDSKTKSFYTKIKTGIIDHVLALMALHKDSFINRKQLLEKIKKLITVTSFEELKIPLKIIVTDLSNGADIVYSSGNLLDILVQSCSIPGVISPTFTGEKIIVDGGVGMPIPVSVLKKECDFSIAIDIGLHELKSLDYSNAKSIARRANIITSNRLKKFLSEQADYVIRPDTLGKNWSDFQYCDELLNQGKIAAKNSIDDLKKKIEEKKQILSV